MTVLVDQCLTQSSSEERLPAVDGVDQCLTQSSSEKRLLAVDVDYVETHSWVMYRVETVRARSPKRENCFP